MRSSILTDLLEVSHIRSIRQIFIAVLVIVFLQVAITDLFELGTYVITNRIWIIILVVFFENRIDFRIDVIIWNFSNISACLRLWLWLFISTCTIVYCSFHIWAYKRLSLIQSANNSTNLCKRIRLELFSFDYFLFQLFSIGFVWSRIAVILDCFYSYLFITFSPIIIRL